MDCPICGAAMNNEPTADDSGTAGWTCFDHGFFPCLCSCGYIKGQSHDILCKKKGKAA